MNWPIWRISIKQQVKQAIDGKPGFIIGIKARMSSSVVGQNGTKPLVLAKEIQQENQQLPLMVHIGNNPPDLDEIADLLTQGDIITHCYNGKPNRILTPAGTLRESIQRALKRGVLLDVGHGSASFSFEVAARLSRWGSSAHHQFRYLLPQPSGWPSAQPGDGDVQILYRWAFSGAGHWLRNGKCRCGVAPDHQGAAETGFDADLTIFDLRQGPQVFADSEGESVNGEQLLVPLAAVVAGEVLLTDQGKAAHVFSL
ncbi:dihydroorotase [Serratia fonticola]|uniref:Dihydroorotase n=1 Tax=Serratia fonticola TaxID=47917 RepID=A0A4U9W9A5_SERFO|nr:dihydroorotase [Serratia fonticola]